MSHKDWKQSLRYCTPEKDTFEALLMAAMRTWPPERSAKLNEAFPEIRDELEARDWLPHGYYPGEVHDENLVTVSNDDTDPFAQRQAERDNAPPSSPHRREDEPGYR